MTDESKPPDSELSSSRLVVALVHTTTQPHATASQANTKITGPFEPVGFFVGSDADAIVQAREEETATTEPHDLKSAARSSTMPDGLVRARRRLDTLTAEMIQAVGPEERDFSRFELWRLTTRGLESLDPDFKNPTLVIDQFHRTWGVHMLGYAQYFTRSLHAAEDLAAEALVQLVQKTKDDNEVLRPMNSLPKMFRTIIRNLNKNRVRDASRRWALLEQFGWTIDPEDTRAQDHALRFTIHAAINEISENERYLLYLRHFEGLTYQQISQVMSTPVTTVMRWAKAAEKTVIDFTTGGAE